ncbi:uncharacterized protein LOC134195629 isoform X2 [Corticium candelabrum]|uniref:uncharacterized protein LOC134195629 isoform X2 n=1 Tax=Corticium candelabrum TaxID=121492 RepID=UPI002E257C63|nr:uncharacterized protein LOC134195629 isoform X2 [Corticium candelabrum]
MTLCGAHDYSEVNHKQLKMYTNVIWQVVLKSSLQRHIKRGSVTGFMKYLGVSLEEAKSLMTRSISLARQAVGEHLAERGIQYSREIHLYGIGQCRLPLIAGSIGPYGACLHDGSEYTGSYVDRVTKQKLKDWHRQRIELFYSEGLRLFACETIPVQLEAEVIVEVMSEFSDAYCWISFSCKDGLHVCHGETLVDAVSSVVHSSQVAPEAGLGHQASKIWHQGVKLLKQMVTSQLRLKTSLMSIMCLHVCPPACLSACIQVIAVGVNCTAPQHVESLLKSISKCSAGRMLLAYPNSGEEWIDSRWEVQEDSSLALVNYLQLWIQAGAKLIGGCCRTRPSDIQSFHQAFHANQN